MITVGGYGGGAVTVAAKVNKAQLKSASTGPSYSFKIA